MSPKPATTSALVKPPTQAVDRFAHGFREYITGLGLPVEGVLVEAQERGVVLANTPALLELVDLETRANSMYISKFVAACGAGLFDAALNFMWDEVVATLRNRVAAFDLAYFYDTAVTTQERKHYQSVDDLPSLSDANLIRGALKCGILTDIGYRHLDYIREMRNWASAAHPNHASLTGLQLVAWLQTCLKEVILKQPEGPVLEVGRLLRNLREQTLAPADVPAIVASVRRLPPPLAAALLRSVAGMYCDPLQAVRVKDNLKLVGKASWSAADQPARGEIGLKYANYSANGDVDRKAALHEFLELVSGLSALPDGTLALEIQQRVAALEATHDGYNNFHHEPAAARDLLKFLPDTGKVPDTVNYDYVRVLVRCRIGRSTGVSNAAVSSYDAVIRLFDQPQIVALVQLLADDDIASQVRNPDCGARYRAIVDRVGPKVVDQRLQAAVGFIQAASDPQLPAIGKDSRFQRLLEHRSS